MNKQKQKQRKQKGTRRNYANFFSGNYYSFNYSGRSIYSNASG